MTTVVVVDVAEEQLREIVEWWHEHRPAAPDLVMDDLDRCVSLLESAPDAGPRFRRTAVPGVRRLIMKRTKHIVYYDAETRSSTSLPYGERQNSALPFCWTR